MELSNLLIKIIVLILPGIISWMLFRKLVGRSSKQKWHDFCEIILFSVITYSSFGIILNIVNYIFGQNLKVVFFQTILGEETQIIWHEIFWAGIIGIVVALWTRSGYFLTGQQQSTKFGKPSRSHRRELPRLAENNRKVL